MLVSLLPGVDRDNVERTLRELSIEAYNLRGDAAGYVADPTERIVRYAQWAHEAAQRLRGQVSQADVDRLILTRPYDRLLTMTDVGTMGIATGLFFAELTARIDDLQVAADALATEIKRWSATGRLVVADTGVYLHGAKFEDIDFAKLIDERQGPLHLVIPLAVVDELDNLKQSKDRLIRWRSRHTLAEFDRLLSEPSKPALARLADYSPAESEQGGVPRGAVTIELLLDPPRHVRLPITDDEIVDRAVAVQALASRVVTLLTYDTGMATRGRIAGLEVTKIPQPPDEPEPDGSRPAPKKGRYPVGQVSRSPKS
ncbi:MULTISPECIES: PIN domain-containing protein [Amycolatopsis]|uniref:PIN domain-containing protein n=1 Tax=Amycolatopsis albidoflavus TaxID=102226 RepID=A0ABW5I756_9PSEU